MNAFGQGSSVSLRRERISSYPPIGDESSPGLPWTPTNTTLRQSASVLGSNNSVSSTIFTGNRGSINSMFHFPDSSFSQTLKNTVNSLFLRLVNRSSALMRLFNISEDYSESDSLVNHDNSDTSEFENGHPSYEYLIPDLQHSTFEVVVSGQGSPCSAVINVIHDSDTENNLLVNEDLEKSDNNSCSVPSSSINEECDVNHTECIIESCKYLFNGMNSNEGLGDASVDPSHCNSVISSECPKNDVILSDVPLPVSRNLPDLLTESSLIDCSCSTTALNGSASISLIGQTNPHSNLSVSCLAECSRNDDLTQQILLRQNGKGLQRSTCSSGNVSMGKDDCMQIENLTQLIGFLKDNGHSLCEEDLKISVKEDILKSLIDAYLLNHLDKDKSNRSLESEASPPIASGNSNKEESVVLNNNVCEEKADISNPTVNDVTEQSSDCLLPNSSSHFQKFVSNPTCRKSQRFLRLLQHMHKERANLLARDVQDQIYDDEDNESNELDVLALKDFIIKIQSLLKSNELDRITFLALAVEALQLLNKTGNREFLNDIVNFSKESFKNSEAEQEMLFDKQDEVVFGESESCLSEMKENCDSEPNFILFDDDDKPLETISARVIPSPCSQDPRYLSVPSCNPSVSCEIKSSLESYADPHSCLRSPKHNTTRKMISSSSMPCLTCIISGNLFNTPFDSRYKSLPDIHCGVVRNKSLEQSCPQSSFLIRALDLPVAVDPKPSPIIPTSPTLPCMSPCALYETLSKALKESSKSQDPSPSSTFTGASDQPEQSLPADNPFTQVSREPNLTTNSPSYGSPLLNSLPIVERDSSDFPTTCQLSTPPVDVEQPPTPSPKDVDDCLPKTDEQAVVPVKYVQLSVSIVLALVVHAMQSLSAFMIELFLDTHHHHDQFDPYR